MDRTPMRKSANVIDKRRRPVTPAPLGSKETPEWRAAREAAKPVVRKKGK